MKRGLDMQGDMMIKAPHFVKNGTEETNVTTINAIKKKWNHKGVIRVCIYIYI